MNDRFLDENRQDDYLDNIAPLVARCSISPTLGVHGSKIAFTEECWGNKKIQVGSTQRSAHKEWTDRLPITENGLALAIKVVLR